jgi:hypothetical protein
MFVLGHCDSPAGPARKPLPDSPSMTLPGVRACDSTGRPIFASSSIFSTSKREGGRGVSHWRGRTAGTEGPSGKAKDQDKRAGWTAAHGGERSRFPLTARACHWKRRDPFGRGCAFNAENSPTVILFWFSAPDANMPSIHRSGGEGRKMRHSSNDDSSLAIRRTEKASGCWSTRIRAANHHDYSPRSLCSICSVSDLVVFLPRFRYLGLTSSLHPLESLFSPGLEYVSRQPTGLSSPSQQTNRHDNVAVRDIGQRDRATYTRTAEHAGYLSRLSVMSRILSCASPQWNANMAPCEGRFHPIGAVWPDMNEGRDHGMQLQQVVGLCPTRGEGNANPVMHDTARAPFPLGSSRWYSHISG